MNSALLAMISSENQERFFDCYHRQQPFVVHGIGKDITALTGLPFLQSLEALLNSWPDVIHAHLPDLRDEASSIETSGRDARKLYDNGMALLFDDINRYSELLSHWLGQLRKDLGLSALTISRCLVYATPNGRGTAAHFDQNINFVLQIHGNKKWKVAANHSVKNPLTRHTLGTPVEAELGSYLCGPLPETMPADAQEFELGPGSLLFVPRGSWHSTLAEGDALALNFTFTAPTWIDLFTAAARGRLSQWEEWRETAGGLSDPAQFKQATARFDLLLGALKEELAHWNATDILGATESSDFE